METPPYLSPPPPVIAPIEGASVEDVPGGTPPVSTWRRAVMLALLLGYILAVGLMSAFSPERTGPALPATTAGLVKVSVVEIGTFGAFFLIAWAFGRSTRDQLYMRRWDGLPTIGWSILWSVAIRMLAIPAVGAYALGLQVYRHFQGGGAVAVDELRPKFENLLATESFKDPVYALMAATLVSFGVGGLREELWRSGVLASFQSLLPATWRNWRGAAAGVVLAALVFGSAHATQGPVGVLATGAIGLGLGAIMVWRKSYWEAALAHGIFDASTMAVLWAIQFFHPDLLKQMLERR